jgi:hypothetical protein
LRDIETVQLLFVLRKGLDALIGHHAQDNERDQRDKRRQQQLAMNREIIEQAGDAFSHGRSINLRHPRSQIHACQMPYLRRIESLLIALCGLCETAQRHIAAAENRDNCFEYACGATGTEVA